MHREVAEFYYVMKDSATATMGGRRGRAETAPVKEGDAFPIQLSEVRVAYRGNKIPTQAIDQYTRALNSEPSCATIHRRLAELYLQKGDCANAALHTK